MADRVAAEIGQGPAGGGLGALNEIGEDEDEEEDEEADAQGGAKPANDLVGGGLVGAGDVEAEQVCVAQEYVRVTMAAHEVVCRDCDCAFSILSLLLYVGAFTMSTGAR